MDQQYDISTARSFRHFIFEMGGEYYRDMPWRQDPQLYNVLISEMMLQQTQVERVYDKYQQFMEAFPTMESLAGADLQAVVALWSGLGYNRRAKYVRDAAIGIMNRQDTQNKWSREELERLPGIGPGTSGAIMTYAYNKYAPFIETNVRTVYIHHFYRDSNDISDAAIMELVRATVDRHDPRQFYWALMDYGTILKQRGYGYVSKSSHYRRQTPLEGSVRQVRGDIVRALHSEAVMSVDELRAATSSDERFDPALTGLVRDGLVQKVRRGYQIAQ